MFSQMKWKIVAAVLGILVIVGCMNTFSGSYKQKNDDVYVMLKGEELYIKYPEKESQKVASNVLEESARYYDGKGLLFLDNDYSLYLYEDGEKQKIANNVSKNYFAYTLSNKTIAYLSDENDLYVIFDAKDKMKVASDISSYRLSSDGERIYYMNEDNELYCFASDEQKDKIASDVDFYNISEDGNKVAIYTSDGDLYVRDINEDDKTKILTDEEIYSYNILIDNNGDLAYLSEYDFDDDKGELYFKSSNDEKSRIASDVTSFQKQDDSFFFLDVDGNLYVKNIKDEKAEKLAEEVQEFYVTDKRVYYIDADDNLIAVKNGKKEKVGTDIAESEYWFEVSTLEENIIFLTKDNDLYFNAEKVSSDVEEYYAYVDRIIYRTTNGDLYSVSANKPDKKEKFEKPSSYSSIYYGNRRVYKSSLTAEDITGVYEIETAYSSGFMEISKNYSSDGSVDVTTYIGYGKGEDEAFEITDATATTVTLEDEYLLTKINDSKWKVSTVDEPDNYYLSLTKSTNEKLTDYKEEYSSYY